MSLDELIAQAVEKRLAPLVERMERALATTGTTGDELLTPREAAQLAKISATTLREWRKRGALKNYGSARSPRYRRSEVLAVTVASKPPTDAKSAAALIPLRRRH